MGTLNFLTSRPVLLLVGPIPINNQQKIILRMPYSGKKNFCLPYSFLFGDEGRKVRKDVGLRFPGKSSDTVVSRFRPIV